MANNKLVSVIMPVYNTRPDYLHTSISSVAMQQGIDPRDMELVMIDDFSDPAYQRETECVVKEFRVRYPNLSILLDPNHNEKGAGNARNTGISMSNGKYISLLDSDDALLPDAIKKSYNEMEKSNQTLVAFSDHIKTDETLTNPIYKRNKRDLFILHGLYKNTLQDPLLHMLFTGPLKTLRRETIEAVGGYMNYRIGEDFNLLLRLSHLTPEIIFSHIAEPLYLYRTNPDSLTSKRDETIKSDEEMLFPTLIELGHDISSIRFFGKVKPQYNFYDLFDKSGELVDVPWLDRETKSIIPHQEMPVFETHQTIAVQPMRSYALG